MTDSMHAGGRPETRVEAMRVVLVIGANRLEILAGPSDVVLDVVRMWLEAIGGTTDNDPAAQAKINALADQYGVQVGKVAAAMDEPITTTSPVNPSPSPLT